MLAVEPRLKSHISIVSLNLKLSYYMLTKVSYNRDITQAYGIIGLPLKLSNKFKIVFVTTCFRECLCRFVSVAMRDV